MLGGLITELHARAKRARVGGAPQLSKSTHPREFGYHVTVHRTNVRPSVRTTGIPMFTVALSSQFGSKEKTDSWFARDVTKNQTNKLSILPSFYFHEVLQNLITFT